MFFLWFVRQPYLKIFCWIPTGRCCIPIYLLTKGIQIDWHCFVLPFFIRLKHARAEGKLGTSSRSSKRSMRSSALCEGECYGKKSKNRSRWWLNNLIYDFANLGELPTTYSTEPFNHSPFASTARIPKDPLRRPETSQRAQFRVEVGQRSTRQRPTAMPLRCLRLWRLRPMSMPRTRMVRDAQSTASREEGNRFDLNLPMHWDCFFCFLVFLRELTWYVMSVTNFLHFKCCCAEVESCLLE